MKMNPLVLAAALLSAPTFTFAQGEHLTEFMLGDWQCNYDVMGFKDTAYITYNQDNTMSGHFNFSYPGMHGKGAFNLSLNVQGSWQVEGDKLVEQYKPKKTRLSIAHGFNQEQSSRFKGDGSMNNQAQIITLTKSSLVLKEQDGTQTDCVRS